MIPRIVALLLIVAWQLQTAVAPHVHAGMSAAELVEHGQRAHVHLSGASHADHDHAHDTADHPHSTDAPDHAERCLAEHAPADHDADAVYLQSGSLADVSPSGPRIASVAVATLGALDVSAVAAGEPHTSAPPRYGGQLPVFLSTARLLL